MQALPIIHKCCHCFPFKCAVVFISFAAILTGGFGITVIVFLALWEDNLAVYVGKLPENQRWPVIGVVGFICTLLLLSGAILLVAPCLKASRVSALNTSFFLIMLMCVAILIITITPSMLCVFSWFNIVDSVVCTKQFVAIEVELVLALFVLVFVSAWCYYGVVVGNYSNTSK